MAKSKSTAPAAAQSVRSKPLPDREVCTVTLTAFPADHKLRVIKAIRETTGLGLQEAKDWTETQLPTTIDLNTVPAAQDAEAMGWSAAVAARELLSGLILAGATAHLGTKAPDLDAARRIDELALGCHLALSAIGGSILLIENDEKPGCAAAILRLARDRLESVLQEASHD